MKAGRMLLDLLFPPRCAFCGRLLPAGADGICPRCQEELPRLTGSERESKGEFFSLCLSPLRYEGAVRQGIHRYKFKGVTACARVFGRVMAECAAENLAGRFDLVTWAPLSAKRRRERGYDQAFLLAQAMSLELGTVAVETLRKQRHIPAQSGLEGAQARRANVLGVYVCPESALVEGKRVLVVDDVVTTGSTLSECARVLLTAGAKEVLCITLAKAGDGK